MNRTYDLFLAFAMPITATVSTQSDRLTISRLGHSGVNTLTVPTLHPDEQIAFHPALTTPGPGTPVECPEDIQWIVPEIALSAADIRLNKSMTKGYLEFGNIYGRTKLIAQAAPPASLSKTSRRGNWVKVTITGGMGQEVEIQLGPNKIYTTGSFMLHSPYPDIFQAIVQIPAGVEIQLSYAQEVSKRDSLLKILSRSQYAQNSV